MGPASVLAERPDSGRIVYVRKKAAIGTDRRHTVAVVVPARVSTFEFAVPCEVFGIDRSDLGVPWYRFMVVSVEDGPIESSGGFTMQAPYRLADLDRADTIVVPAAHHEEAV